MFKKLLCYVSLFTLFHFGNTLPALAVTLLIGFDIDETVADCLSEYPDEAVEAANFEDCFTYFSPSSLTATYHVTQATREVIQWVTELPNVKIFYISKGQKSRNLALLAHFRLPNGKTLLQAGENRVISAEDLLSKKLNHKNLEIIPELYPDLEFDLEYTLTIDDQILSYSNKHQRNVIWLRTQSNLNYILNETEKPKRTLLICSDQKRLEHAKKILQYTLRVSKNKGITPKAALMSIQWKERANSDDTDLPLKETHTYIAYQIPPYTEEESKSHTHSITSVSVAVVLPELKINSTPLGQPNLTPSLQIASLLDAGDNEEKYLDDGTLLPSPLSPSSCSETF